MQHIELIRGDAVGSGVSWPIGPGVFSRRAGRSSWRRPRTARRSGWRGPCGTRGLPRPPAPPGGSPPSTSSLCLWLPPGRCLPLPLPSPRSLPGRTPRGLLLCPQSQHSSVLLGWPWDCGSRAQGVSSGQAAKAAGLLPGGVVAPQARPQGTGALPWAQAGGW